MRIGDKTIDQWVSSTWSEKDREAQTAEASIAKVADFIMEMAKLVGCREGEDITPVLALLPASDAPFGDWTRKLRSHGGALRHVRRTWQKAYAKAGAWKSSESGAVLVSFVVEKAQLPPWK